MKDRPDTTALDTAPPAVVAYAVARDAGGAVVRGYRLSVLFRAALAVIVALLVLAVLRWAPVYAESPFPVRALPLAGPAVVLAVLVALTARERPSRPLRPFLIALLACSAALVLLVALRPAAGLPAPAARSSTGLRRLAAAPLRVRRARVPARAPLRGSA